MEPLFGSPPPLDSMNRRRRRARKQRPNAGNRRTASRLARAAELADRGDRHTAAICKKTLDLLGVSSSAQLPELVARRSGQNSPARRRHLPRRRRRKRQVVKTSVSLPVLVPTQVQPSIDRRITNQDAHPDFEQAKRSMRGPASSVDQQEAFQEQLVATLKTYVQACGNEGPVDDGSANANVPDTHQQYLEKRIEQAQVIDCSSRRRIGQEEAAQNDWYENFDSDDDSGGD